MGVQATFHKICFTVTFGCHLEFLHKTQKHVNGAREISTNFLTHRVSAESTGRVDFDNIFDPQGICKIYWRVFPKIIFPPLLVAILDLCVKRQKKKTIKKTHLQNPVFLDKWKNILNTGRLAFLQNY